MTASTLELSAFENLEPEALENGIFALLASYQDSRSGLIAWFVVRYAQALCKHPDFEGSDEERCAWQRLAAQWRWLAQVPASKVAVLEGEVA